MSFSAGIGSLFGAFGAKITERDAIMRERQYQRMLDEHIDRLYGLEADERFGI